MTREEIDADVEAAANRAGANGTEQQARQAWRDVVNAAQEAREATGAVSDDLETLRQWLDGARLDNDAAMRFYAGLNAVERDQLRKPVAERLGIRVTTLDAEVKDRTPKAGSKSGSAVDFEALEPWPDAVTGSDVLDEVAALFRRYIVVPDYSVDTLTLWTAFTYGYDHFDVCPMLCLTSPLMRCGKTQTITVLSATVDRPLPAANITPPALFRAVEAWNPTLLIDEGDTFVNRSEELRGILNSGHTRATAFVVRTVEVNGDHEPRKFSTWGPKAVALIGDLKDTLADRSISVRMEAKTAEERVERLRAGRIVDEAADLRRKLRRWVNDNAHAFDQADPPDVDGLNDRASDNWRPLLALADAAGGTWPERARKAAGILSGGRDGDAETLGVELLKDIQAIISQTDQIKTATLVSSLNDLEDRPWPEVNRGKPMNARKLANMLRPFGISSKDIRFGHDVVKGYRADAFEDAFRRYIPAHKRNKRNIGQNDAENADFPLFASATDSESVADVNSQNRPKQAGNSNVADVALGKGVSGEGTTFFDLDSEDEAPF